MQFDTARLHPRVRRSYRGVKAALIIGAVLLVAAGVVPFPWFHRAFPDKTLFYLLALVLPLFVALLAVGVFFRLRVQPRLHQMSHVMTTRQPRPMRLTGLGGSLRHGERVALRDPESPEAGPPLALVRVDTPSDGAMFPKNRSQPVTVYLEHDAPGAFVVLDTEDQLAWGRLLEAEAENA